ncbi:hypothetical protein MKW94_023226 [Papaver nudicaule]|uniref:Uncharacterized protein n=1 Tax=Papaver nudicaule TaxID=74823 RepID=A0AA41SFL1_PAPNU|nr:hypothetical protein [Papaver nudicaule]
MITRSCKSLLLISIENLASLPQKRFRYTAYARILGTVTREKIVCIKHCFSNSTSNVVYEVYDLNEYDYDCSATNADNHEYSWSILYTFTIYDPCGGLGYAPKAITKNGVIGFIRGITGEMTDIDASLEGIGDIFRGGLYKESLVSIDSSVPSSSNNI